MKAGSVGGLEWSYQEGDSNEAWNEATKRGLKRGLEWSYQEGDSNEAWNEATKRELQQRTSHF